MTAYLLGGDYAAMGPWPREAAELVEACRRLKLHERLHTHRGWSSPRRFQVNDFEGVTRKSESERRRRTWVSG